MLITNYQEIEELFTAEIAESGQLDYKKQLYQLTKEQCSDNGKRKKDAAELLKDVCSFLNSGGGSIVLGVKDDAKSGAPLGTIEEAGVENTSFPAKYAEMLEKRIVTGMSPICQVDIRQIVNEKNSERSFLVINIPLQHSPLFSRVKNADGAEDYSIFIRRGRNTGNIEPREIEVLIDNFRHRRDRFKDKIEVLSSPTADNLAMPIFIAHPLTPLNFHALDYQDHLRGVDSWENPPGTSYRVTVNETNIFPLPTMEGIEIKEGHRRLQIQEDGLIYWAGNHLEHELIRFQEPNGQKMSSQFKLIEPDSLSSRIINFCRFSLQTYHKLHYWGEFEVHIKLLGMRQTMLCISSREFVSTVAELKSDDGYLSTETINTYRGPRECGESSIEISVKLSTLSYGPSNLEKLDTFVREKILNYIWRAYGFSEFT